MNNPSNEPIESLLRASFDGPVPDAGFSERVMQALPARRNHRRWLLPAGIVAGTFACWVALTPTPLMRVASHDWANGKLSATSVVVLAAVAGMSLLAAWWAMSEADDAG